jgi:hypothetical protein
MKILFLQDGLAHQKNHNLRESVTLQKGLRELGHEADIWGANHTFDCDMTKLPDFDTYDVIVDMWEIYHQHLNLSSIDTKKLLWSCDAHVQGEQFYLQVMESGGYDCVLTNARDLFSDVKSFWFKPWYDSDIIRNKNLEKKNFIGFCGNRNPERDHEIDSLNVLYDMKLDIFVIGDDMVDAINSYHIHFNKNLGEPHGLSYRVVETLGCGSVLLTNKSYMYDDMGLESKKNCLIYDSYESMIDLIEWAKDNPKEVLDIANAGNSIAHQFNHIERANDLVSIIESM